MKKNSSKFLGVLTSLVLVFAFMTGCATPAAETSGGNVANAGAVSDTETGGSADDTSQNTGESNATGLLTDGVLQVAMEIGYPPFELYADDGVTPIGLDVELAAELGKKLGVRVEYIDTAWDGIFTGLEIDKYDVVISAVTINALRKKTMDFTSPYIENWQAIVVRKGEEAVTSVEGLNGQLVGFQDATASHEYLEEFMETGVVDCETAAYDKVLNAFDDLRLGRLDCILTDSTVAEGYISREPNQFEITWHQQEEADAEAELFGIAVKKGNTPLLEALNNALAALEEDGTLNQLRDAWLS